MLCKFNLIIGDTIYELSNSDIRNWQDISYSINQSDYGATTRKFTSKFDFINQAYELLFAEYCDDYLASSAIIEVYTITNIHTYEIRFSCPLDFSSLKKEGKIISMNAIDGSISALIKAKKGTQYEYAVNEIKEDKELCYDRIHLLNRYNFSMNDFIRVYPAAFGDIFITSYNNEISSPRLDTDTNERYVICEIQNVPTDGILFSFDIDIYLDDKTIGEFYPAESVDFVLTVPGHEMYDTILRGKERAIKREITITKNDFDSSTDKRIYFKIKGIGWDESHTYKVADIYIRKINDFSISYYDILSPVDISVISPTIVLNRLLQSMNGGENDITGIITSGIDYRLDNCLILAAESIRNISDAKLYSSYNKFMEWMEAEFGFVPVIDEENKTVTFTHRDKLFINTVSRKIENTGRDTSYSLDSSLIYSRVRVGYDKQDYDSINGRDEFHFTNEYTTGISLSDNSYDIISPFRADPYGIEFLTQSRGKDTTDNNSDNDVFFVCAELDPDRKKYLLVRSGYTVSGVISPATMFNAMYSPRFMLEANKSFIGVFAKSLTFASSEGNSDVIINGEKESGNVEIATALFTVGVLDVTTDDESLPKDLNGLLQVEYDDKTYCGYAKEVKCKYGQYDGMKYKLIVKSIE